MFKNSKKMSKDNKSKHSTPTSTLRRTGGRSEIENSRKIDKIDKIANKIVKSNSVKRKLANKQTIASSMPSTCNQTNILDKTSFSQPSTSLFDISSIIGPSPVSNNTKLGALTKESIKELANYSTFEKIPKELKNSKILKKAFTMNCAKESETNKKWKGKKYNINDSNHLKELWSKARNKLNTGDTNKTEGAITLPNKNTNFEPFKNTFHRINNEKSAQSSTNLVSYEKQTTSEKYISPFNTPHHPPKITDAGHWIKSGIKFPRKTGRCGKFLNIVVPMN